MTSMSLGAEPSGAPPKCGVLPPRAPPFPAPKASGGPRDPAPHCLQGPRAALPGVRGHQQAPVARGVASVARRGSLDSASSEEELGFVHAAEEAERSRPGHGGLINVMKEVKTH